MSKNCPPLLACPQFFFMLLRCKSANLGVIRTCAEREEQESDLLFLLELHGVKRVAFMEKTPSDLLDMSQYHAIPCNFFRMLHTRCHYITNPNNAPSKRKSLKMTHIFASSFIILPPNKWVISNDPLEHTSQLCNFLKKTGRQFVCPF